MLEVLKLIFIYQACAAQEKQEKTPFFFSLLHRSHGASSLQHTAHPFKAQHIFSHV